ncbi:integral membrane sensor signal transduction histidine kinase [Rivularia sp. IAM M-261]|nr:integral membrane sensor signal transduction histidine kinase [Rivularia sp. IAM M-261]
MIQKPSSTPTFPWLYRLQSILIIPFILQIIGAVGLVGYLSYQNGQKAVSDLANQLMTRSSGMVNQQLDSYLSTPHKISQINADAIRLGLLDVNNGQNPTFEQRKAVGKYLWHQMQAYDMSYIWLSFPTGESIGSARYDGKTILYDDIKALSPSLPKNVTSYLTDNQGNPTQAISNATWDTLNEVPYQQPIKAGKPTWNRIYTYYDPNYPPYIAASAGRPVYDKNNKLIAVTGSDIHLLKLSEYLNKLDITRTGHIFIVEHNGMLIANSGDKKPFVIANNQINRLQAVNSDNTKIKSIAKQIKDKFGSFEKISNIQKLQLQLQKDLDYVHITPWRDEYGLDWLVVVSVPETTFMEQIHQNTRTTILLCFGALAVATVIGIYTSRWIMQPLLRLNGASKAIASGDLNQTIQDINIYEFNTLAQSFNNMAGQLRDSFSELETTNEQLEQRVEERTAELKHALIELQQTQAQMLQSEKMSSLGQLVAGVAHEINNPVSFIFGNLTHVQEYTKNLLEFIQLYQQEYSEPVAKIVERSEEIDLEFLQEDLPKVLSSMKIGAERIREIVLSLRNFSRMDEADIKPVNIHEGIDSTLLILQHRLKAQIVRVSGEKEFSRPEIQVVKDYQNLPEVQCYAGQLNQVFMNILANAIDALETRSIKLTEKELEQHPNKITISTSCLDKQWIQVAIIDNGTGIPKNIQKNIFNPFFTTKPVGKGTGMGLSISYKIITEKHHGKLECFSEEGTGTEFVILIPITQRFS